VAFSNIDRTVEVESGFIELKVKSTDYCSYFEKHPYTFLQRKECWTCKFSDFGIESGTPACIGVCDYQLQGK
jgi:hypothetical protein